MPLKLDSSIFVRLDWESDYGRTFEHAEDEPYCMTCPDRPVYGQSCEAAGHARDQTKHTRIQEAAPDEAKVIRRLYGAIDRKFHRLGYSLGKGVYLISQSAPLDATLQEINEMLTAANAEFKVCRADFNPFILEIVPDAVRETTLKSLQRSVENGVQDLLAALDSTDAKRIREALLRTKNLAALLENQDRRKVDELASYAKKVAKRLRDAAEISEAALVQVQDEARQGTKRFANVFHETAAEAARATLVEATTAAEPIEVVRPPVRALDTVGVAPLDNRQQSFPFPGD